MTRLRSYFHVLAGIVGFMLSFAMQAQPLHFDHSSVWSEELWRYEGLEAHHFVYSISIAGDTMIQGTDLMKLRREGLNTITPLLGNPPPPPNSIPIDEYAGALRSDSIAGQWWVVLPGEPQEQLLYRFDMAIGDAVTGTFGDCSGAPTVTAIDQVWFNGHFRRRFILDNGFRHIIEGIGASSGLFGHLCQFFEEYSCLQSYTQGAVDWQVLGCDGITIGAPEVQAEPDVWRAFPNPTTGPISLGGTAAGQMVLVVDLAGRMVTSAMADARGALDLTRLATGMYVLHIQNRRIGIVRS